MVAAGDGLPGGGGGGSQKTKPQEGREGVGCERDFLKTQGLETSLFGPR